LLPNYCWHPFAGSQAWVCVHMALPSTPTYISTSHSHWFTLTALFATLHEK
jgi:hypothetical protein